MANKQQTIDAAERRQISAELKDLNTAERKIKSDWRNEQKRLIAEAKKADKALNAFMKRAEKQMPRALGDIDRRRAVLRGRLGA